jgi:hypothetical protein
MADHRKEEDDEGGNAPGASQDTKPPHLAERWWVYAKAGLTLLALVVEDHESLRPVGTGAQALVGLGELVVFWMRSRNR